ncbi:hypothetical protein AB0G04_31250 [Actinoplanes sp. NPDC023801]|uniref:hypothetical protein n=1 Tax=Actinoplanes sp. NPDC023801 TaxID=3154595 RepID=UPI0033DD4C96
MNRSPRAVHRFYRRRRAVALARADRAFATLSAEDAQPDEAPHQDLTLFVGVPRDGCGR